MGPSSPAPTTFMLMPSRSRATVHSAMPRVSQLVLIQRPSSLFAFASAAPASRRSACKWLCCLKSSCVIALKVLVSHGVILAQKVARSSAVVFEEMKLREHQQALHDHSLKTRFGEAKIVTAREAGSRSGRGIRCKDVGRRRAPVDQAIWSN